MTMTLYKIADEFQAVLARAEDPNVDLAELEQDLARVAGNFKAKAGNIAYFMTELQHTQEGCAKQAKRLAARAKRAEAVYDWLRKVYLLDQMKAIGQDSIDTGDFTLAITKNPPACEVFDENLVPGRFKTIIPQPDQIKIDKDAIKAYIKATGEVIPGVAVTQGEHVALR